jgi:hypothetical protein
MGVLLTLSVSDRGRLELSRHRHAERRISPLPVSAGPVIWFPAAAERSSCIRGLASGSSAATGTARSLRGSDKRSIEGGAERGLLLGVSNLSERRTEKPNRRNEGGGGLGWCLVACPAGTCVEAL